MLNIFAFSQILRSQKLSKVDTLPKKHRNIMNQYFCQILYSRLQNRKDYCRRSNPYMKIKCFKVPKHLTQKH